MRLDDVMSLLERIEERVPVDEWRWGSIRVWPCVRGALSDAVNSYPVVSLQAAASPRPPPLRRVKVLGRKLKTWGYVSLFDIRHRASAWRADVVCLDRDTSRAWVLDSWYDRFVEPITEACDELGHSTLHLELSYERRSPRHDRSKLISGHVALWKARAAQARHGPSVVLPEFELFARVLAEAGVDQSRISKEGIARRMAFIGIAESYFARLLKRVDAKVGFVVARNDITMAFNHACWSRGIDAVEVQHGVQGSLHPSYARWNRVPAEGFSLLPSVFWVWSEDEADVIHDWAQAVPARHRAVVAGNPWLERWRTGSVVPDVKAIDKFVVGLKERSRGRVHVLVTLQTCQTLDDIDLFVDVIRRSPVDWRWWVRSHPVMTSTDVEVVRRRFANAGITSAEFDQATRLPLYGLLRHADAHLTYLSSVVIEAREFGLRSIAVAKDAHLLYPKLVDEGTVQVICESGAIVAALDEARRARRALSPAEAHTPISDLLSHLLPRLE